LVAIAFANSGITDAESLVQAILNCTCVWQWDATLQNWVGHPKGGPNNFALIDGNAYLVACTAAGSFDANGPWAAAAFALKARYNLITLPSTKSALTTAEQLARDIPNCTGVWRWSVAAQNWVSHPKGGPNDFGVAVGDVLLVFVTVGGNWP
jgi:hypothetical protein